MKLTNQLRREIKKAVREAVGGYTARPFLRIGHRGEPRWLPNALLWTDDDDLGETYPLDEMLEINDDPLNPGCVMLDAYVYERRPDWEELMTYCYVFIRDGKVIGATAEEREIEALRAKFNFPQTRGW